MANLSGGTRVVAIYARELTRMGHSVRVVCPPPQPIPLQQKLKRWAKGYGWVAEADRQRSHLVASGVDWQVLEQWRPVVDDDVPDADVVVATWWETAEWVNALSARKGAKVYFIQHHEIFDHLPQARCRATYLLPFHKIVVAGWLKEVMNTEYDDVDVDLVPNSVDKSQFFAEVRSKQDVPTIGLLYSPVDFKGVATALAAIESAKAKIPNLRILSFGAHRPTRKLPLSQGAEYFFSPPQDRIRDIYSRCDVWITASKSEGFNLPAMEAMACRTPVVSTRTGWPAEAIVSGWNGWLTEIDDVAELSNGIAWILGTGKDEWRRLSRNAFATVAETSWQASAKLFEESLEHATERAYRGEIAGLIDSTDLQAMKSSDRVE
nr:glycosyltransferase family 4 protein [Bradyrhizobium sp. CCBAU 11434]